jgi:predicted MFS family arabinose efflux permease
MSSRGLVAVLAVSAFIGMTLIVSFDLLMPLIAEELNRDVSSIAQISMVMYVVGASIGLLLGPLADHYGLRRIMMYGGVLLSLSALLTALSTGYWMLLLSRLPAGIGIMGAVGVAVAASRLPEGERRKGIGWISTTVPLAAIAGSPGLGLIAAQTNWRVSYAVLASIFLLLVFLIWRFVPADPPWPASRFNARDVIRAYDPILRHPPSVLLYLADMFRGASTWFIWIFLSAFLIQAQGFSLQQVSATYTGIGIMYVLGTRFGNGDVQSISLQWLMITSTFAMIPIGTLFLLDVINTPFALVLLGSYTFLAGIGFPALTILISEESRGGQGATLMLRRTALSASQALAAGGGGVLLASGGFSAIGLGVAISGLVAVGCGLAAIRLSADRAIQPAAAGE